MESLSQKAKALCDELIAELRKEFDSAKEGRNDLFRRVDLLENLHQDTNTLLAASRERIEEQNSSIETLQQRLSVLEEDKKTLKATLKQNSELFAELRSQGRSGQLSSTWSMAVERPLRTPTRDNAPSLPASLTLRSDKFPGMTPIKVEVPTPLHSLATNALATGTINSGSCLLPSRSVADSWANRKRPISLDDGDDSNDDRDEDILNVPQLDITGSKRRRLAASARSNQLAGSADSQESGNELRRILKELGRTVAPGSTKVSTTIESLQPAEALASITSPAEFENAREDSNSMDNVDEKDQPQQLRSAIERSNSPDPLQDNGQLSSPANVTAAQTSLTGGSPHSQLLSQFGARTGSMQVRRVSDDSGDEEVAHDRRSGLRRRAERKKSRKAIENERS